MREAHARHQSASEGFLQTNYETTYNVNNRALQSISKTIHRATVGDLNVFAYHLEPYYLVRKHKKTTNPTQSDNYHGIFDILLSRCTDIF